MSFEPANSNQTNDDTRLQLTAFLHSDFLAIFGSGLAILIGLSITLGSIFPPTVGWPKTNTAGQPWSANDYLDYSSQYAGLIGAIIAIIGITVNNSSYLLDKLTEHLKRFLPSAIYSLLALANIWMTLSIALLLKNVQHPNLNIIIIGFGFNFLTALSPIILIFLTQAVAPERAQARIDSIKKDRAIINEKFSSMHSLSTSIEDQPKRLMKSIASFLKLKWVYISSWVILFLTAIGVAVQVLKYFGAFRIQGRLLSSVTVITYASAATSLIIAVAYILFRKFYELFIYNPWVRSCVLLTLFLQALQLEFILIIPAHYFSVKITASKTGGMTLFYLTTTIFTLLTVTSISSIVSKSTRWNGVLLPKYRYAQEQYNRLKAEEDYLSKLLQPLRSQNKKEV